MAKYKDSTYAERAMSKMKRRDLQRACLVRGIGFRELAESSDLELQSWFMKNYNNPVDSIKLDEYDHWHDEFLKKERGYKGKKLRWAFHNDLKMGFTPTVVLEGKRAKRIKGFKKPVLKAPKLADSKTGVLRGTKKDITFQGALKGYTFLKTLGQVIEKFPDAQEKSVKIWYKQALKKFGKEEPKEPEAPDYIKRIRVLYRKYVEPKKAKHQKAFWLIFQTLKKPYNKQVFDKAFEKMLNSLKPETQKKVYKLIKSSYKP